MSESVPTTWNDDRDAAFFGIINALAHDGFAAATRIDKLLDDVATAESWESMALRSASHSTPSHRDLVPVPVRTRRRPS